MTFLLAHLSDPHIGPLPTIPLSKLINKRLTGTLNWHRSRAGIHNMAVFQALIDDIIAQSPDHVALTGDLVNVGYATEFPQALAATRRLGGPDAVSIIPGNHDAYVRGSLAAMEAHFAPFMGGDHPESGVTFPFLRRRGPIALIGVNTGIPTLPFMATGRIGIAQRERLGRLLDATGREGLYRVVMMHHPPLRAAARFARGLVDAGAVTALLERHGAELVVHGHNHRHSLRIIEGSAGPIPIVGVASASAVPGTPRHLAEYNLIAIEPEQRRLSLTRRGLVTRGGPIGTIAAVDFPARR